MAYSFPHTLTAGTPENVTDVMDNFTGHATDTEYAYSTYKTIIAWIGGPVANLSVGGIILNGGGASQQATQQSVEIFYFDPADYTSASRTTKLRVRAAAITNQVAPAITFVFGLYPVTVSYGSSGNANAWSLGTVTSGSSVTFTTPSASSTSQSNSGDFTAPSAGYYAVAVTASGSSAAGAYIDLRASLQMRQV